MYPSYLMQKKVPWIWGLRFDSSNYLLTIHVSVNTVELLNKYCERWAEEINQLSKLNDYKSTTFKIGPDVKVFGYENISTVECRDKIISFMFPVMTKSRNPNVRKRHSSKLCKTLSFLLGALKFYIYQEIENMKIPDNETPLQIFEMETVTIAEMHGHALGGFISPEFRKFMAAQAGTPYGETRTFSESFRKEIKKLFKYDGGSRIHFEEKGGFFVEVPGNACDIAVYGEERSQPIERGAEFQSHNVDSPHQQLGLLVGFAIIVNQYYEKYPERDYLTPPK